MKILSLNLLAFGPFSGRSLDFDREQATLHIVYGSNEAGKSSSLRALRHLLYGFPPKCPDNFIHSYTNLRVGGILQDSRGKQLEFICRKGTTNTLRDANDDRVIEPRQLTDMLGGVDEHSFRQRFGIGHEELRSGGKAIVDGGGELGAILFAADTGMPNIRQVQGRIESDFQALFRASGSNPKINRALAELKEAEKRLKEAQVPTSDWVEQDQALQTARERLAATDSNLQAKRTRMTRLERLIKAHPLLIDRNLWRERQAVVPDTPILPEDFAAQRGEAQLGLESAVQARDEAEQELAKLRAMMQNEQLPESLLASRVAIEALQAGLGSHQTAQRHRPGLVAVKEERDAGVRQILKELGREQDLSDLDGLRLTRLQRQQIQELAAEHKACFDRLASAEAAVQKRDDELRTLEQTLNSLAPLRDVDELQNAISKARRQGPLDRQLQEARCALEQVQEDADIELKQLQLFTGTLAELEQLAVCDVETVNRFEKSLIEVQEQLRLANKQIKGLEKDLRSMDAQLQELQLAHDVPTEADLREARLQRDVGWQLVRRMLVDESVAADPESLAFIERFAGETDLPYAYQVSVERADTIADRLRHEAEQVARKAQLTASRRERAEQLQHEQGQLTAITARLETLQSEWQTHWCQLPAAPLPPREMLSWLTRRNALLEKSKAIRIQTANIARQEEQLSTLRNALLAQLARHDQAVMTADCSLEVVLEASETVANAIQAANKKRETDTQKLAKMQEDRIELQRAVAEAEADQKRWKTTWARAVAAIGLPESATPGEANAVIQAIDDLLAQHKDSAAHASRIAGIDSDAQAFKKEVQTLVAEVASDLAELPVDRAVSELAERLTRATKLQTRLDGWREQLRAEETKRDKAVVAVQRWQSKLESLCKTAQCTDANQLPEIERRSALHREYTNQLKAIEEQLVGLASGEPLETFLEAVNATSLEAMQTEFEKIADEVQQLDRAKTEVAKEIGARQEKLESMVGNDHVAEAQEQVEHLLATIRRDAEQYIRLRLAAVVLKRSIERFSEKGQGPVIERAGNLFADLTLGAFSGLRADYDDQGKATLVGVRAETGQTVGVVGLSDGTCDQLYLALRLALLESYLETHEPMPFIMDDTLIQFDDDRTVAALKILAEFSEKTQVIYFTHHRHLVELAQKHLGNAAQYMTISNPLVPSSNDR